MTMWKIKLKNVSTNKGKLLKIYTCKCTKFQYFKMTALQFMWNKLAEIPSLRRSATELREMAWLKGTKILTRINQKKETSSITFEPITYDNVVHVPFKNFPIFFCSDLYPKLLPRAKIYS